MPGDELVRFRLECSTSMYEQSGLNTICKRFSYDCCTFQVRSSTVCYGLVRVNTTQLDIYRVYIRSLRLLFEFDSIRFIYDIDTVELTRGVDFMCGCTVSNGLSWYCKVSHGLSWSCSIANTIIHGHDTRVSFLKF